ncbi:MAG: Ig-like domain-containing protein [Myxococcaceae bacterium]|nr:Ig-like domain-containing protein [Myxococcaceae bacterium]
MGEGPSLIGTVPSDGSTGASAGAGLSLQFSRAVSRSSLAVSIAPAVALGEPTLEAEGAEVRFPAPGLQPGVSYVVTVTAADAEGRALVGPGTFRFTTAAQVDSMAPVLQSSAPASGALQVPVGTAVTLTFSEAMDTSSLAVSFEPPADVTVAWSMGNTVATLTPSAPFEPSTAWLLSVAASDVAGNAMKTSLTFTTAAAPDAVAPTVTMTAPAANATAVPTNAGLSITFSEAMQKSAVDAAFSISPAVAGTALWDASDSLRTFQPTAPLAASTQYTVTVGVAAKDAAGNALAAPFSFSFTTAAAPDTAAPSVVSFTPANGATGVSRSTNITVTFSEPMDKASVQVAFGVTAPPAFNVGTFTWSADGLTMTFNPTGTLPYGQAVSWRLMSGAKDLAGNALPAQLSRGFMVVREGVLVVDATAPLDGYITNGNLVSTGSGFLLAGDSGGNVGFRSFLSFDLSGLPATTQRISQVNLFAYLSGWQGTPRANLGGALQLEHVDYGASLEAADYDVPRFMNLGDSVDFGPAIESQGWKVSNAAIYPVSNDWVNRQTRGNRTQFRLRFPNQVSVNGASDMYTYYSGNTTQMNCPRQGAAAPSTSCKPHLIVTYEYP